jgi:hypothetical protein
MEKESAAGAAGALPAGVSVRRTDSLAEWSIRSCSENSWLKASTAKLALPPEERLLLKVSRCEKSESAREGSFTTWGGRSPGDTGICSSVSDAARDTPSGGCGDSCAVLSTDSSSSMAAASAPMAHEHAAERADVCATAALSPLSWRPKLDDDVLRSLSVARPAYCFVSRCSIVEPDPLLSVELRAYCFVSRCSIVDPTILFGPPAAGGFAANGLTPLPLVLASSLPSLTAASNGVGLLGRPGSGEHASKHAAAAGCAALAAAGAQAALDIFEDQSSSE